MREHLIGPIVYRLGRHPFTVQRGVRFPLGLFCPKWGLTDNQSGGGGCGEAGVFDPDSGVGAVAQFG